MSSSCEERESGITDAERLRVTKKGETFLDEENHVAPRLILQESKMACIIIQKLNRKDVSFSNKNCTVA